MAIVLRPEERDLARINQAIRELIEGRMNGVGTVTLTPGATSTVVNFVNCSKDSHVFLSPLSANAAAALATTYINQIAQGSFTINHANTPTVNRIFSFLCIGG